MWHTIIIAGNVGSDPEMRFTANGQAVTTFSVASNRTYRNSNDQQVKETVWFRVSVWGKQAESTSQYLKKGSKVLVEGRLTPDANGSPRTFQRKDGTTGSSFEVNASTVRFLSSRGEDTSSGEEVGGAESSEEIPF